MEYKLRTECQEWVDCVKKDQEGNGLGERNRQCKILVANSAINVSKEQKEQKLNMGETWWERGKSGSK